MQNQITTYIPTSGKNKGKEVKQFKPPKGWNEFNFETAPKYDNPPTVCNMTGELAGITIIDFDDKDYYKQFVKEHPELKKHHIRKTRRGYHIYFNYDSRFGGGAACFIGDGGETVDIRNKGGFVFAYPTKYKLLDGSNVEYGDCKRKILDMPDYIYDMLKDNYKLNLVKEAKSIKSKVVKKVVKTSNKLNKEEEVKNEVDIVDLIDVKYLNDFDVWLRIVWAMKSNGYTEDKIREISMKSPEYTDDGFNNAFNKAPSNITITAATLNYYAKMSNQKMYYELLSSNKNYITDSTDYTLAKILFDGLGDDFLLINDKLHMYNFNPKTENYKWNLDVIKTGINRCQEFFINHLPKLINNNNEDMNILIKKSIDKIKSMKNMPNVYLNFQMMLSKRYDDVEFNLKQPNVLCFNNIAFNVKTNEEYVVKKDDYLTFTTGYNYKKSTEKQMKFLTEIIKNILPDPEIEKCYLSVGYSGCTSIRPEKLFICIGDGRNGKGVLNELLSYALGPDYYHKGDSTNLTQQRRDGSSANVDLANCNKKRLSIYSEIEHNSTLCMGVIKELTGCDTISARTLHSTDTKCTMNHTVILECNEAPLIDCKIDSSVTERMVLIKFPTIFTDDKQKLESDNVKYKPLNPYLKTEEFKKEYAPVLIEYIMEHAPREIYIPQVVKNESLKYLEGTNNVYTWFEQEYEESEGQHVLMNELFESFKISEQYKNMTKQKKVNFLFKNFKDKILASPLINNYKEVKKINGKTKKNVLINYKEKNEVLVF